MTFDVIGKIDTGVLDHKNGIASRTRRQLGNTHNRVTPGDITEGLFGDAPPTVMPRSISPEKQIVSTKGLGSIQSTQASVKRRREATKIENSDLSDDGAKESSLKRRMRSTTLNRISNAGSPPTLNHSSGQIVELAEMSPSLPNDPPNLAPSHLSSPKLFTKTSPVVAVAFPDKPHELQNPIVPYEKSTASPFHEPLSSPPSELPEPEGILATSPQAHTHFADNKDSVPNASKPQPIINSLMRSNLHFPDPYQHIEDMDPLLHSGNGKNVTQAKRNDPISFLENAKALVTKSIKAIRGACLSCIPER